jgi:spore germination protein GerM
MRLVRSAIVWTGVALLLAACGSNEPAVRQDEARPAAARAPGQAVRTTVYFLVDHGSAPIGVRRDLGRVEARVPIAKPALQALLRGPSQRERREGVTSALPDDARLASLAIDSAGTATVRLDGVPDVEDAPTGTVVRAITQIARTVIGVSGIERVRILVDGRPWGLRLMTGEVETAPYDYADLRSFYGICGAAPGTEAVPVDCFTALP